MIEDKSGCFLAIFKRYATALNEMDELLMFPNVLDDSQVPSNSDVAAVFPKSEPILNGKDLHSTIKKVTNNIFITTLDTPPSIACIPSMVKTFRDSIEMIANVREILLRPCPNHEHSSLDDYTYTAHAHGTEKLTATSNDDFINLISDFGCAVNDLEEALDSQHSCRHSFSSEVDMTHVNQCLHLPSDSTWDVAFEYMKEIRNILFRCSEQEQTVSKSLAITDMIRDIHGLQVVFDKLTDLCIHLIRSYAQEMGRTGDADDRVADLIADLSRSSLATYKQSDTKEFLRRSSWQPTDSHVDILRYNPDYYDFRY